MPYTLFTLLIFFLTSLPLKASTTFEHFKKVDAPMLGKVITDNASNICQLAQNTQTYIENFPEDTFAVKAGTVFEPQVTLERVVRTLEFLCVTYHEDVKVQRKSRLDDPHFLQQHFEFYRWNPDIKTAQNVAKKSTNATKTRMLNAIPSDKIFLTKYYTKLLKGSKVKTATFNQALYALPFDEQGLTLEEADTNLSLTRHTYTRQQVIDGVLERKQLAKPLIWLTEEALHDVLLQGTGVLDINGKRRYFNVHRNNGIAYDYAIGKREQARYWYFSEVPNIMGYGKTQDSKIELFPHVTFAGNVKELGLGKLFMVSYKTANQRVSHMGILADQGGAFDNNLFQLDFLVDSYFGWKDYHKANKHLPDYAQAWLMLVK